MNNKPDADETNIFRGIVWRASELALVCAAQTWVVAENVVHGVRVIEGAVGADDDADLRPGARGPRHVDQQPRHARAARDVHLQRACKHGHVSGPAGHSAQRARDFREQGQTAAKAHRHSGPRSETTPRCLFAPDPAKPGSPRALGAMTRFSSVLN